jgi:hypothetical protein
MHHDFDRLGVSVGHRRRMLKAIRARGGSAPATPQVATAAPGAPQPSPTWPIRANRGG